MRYIEGLDRNQRDMLPEFLEDYVSDNNPVRVIDAFVDSLDLEQHGIGAHHNKTGRPPFSPWVLLKLYIYGYFNNIRSSRRLEKETKRNIELMWLLNKLTPDHMTIARFRSDNKDALNYVFRDFVKLCQKLNLYGSELVAIDGSLFAAVNSLENNFNKAKLEDRIKNIDEKIVDYLSDMDAADREELDDPELSREEIAEAILAASERRRKYESMLATLDETGETQLSTTDPDARRMKRKHSASDVCYNIQTAVDEKNKMIVEFEVTNHNSDANLMSPMAVSAKEALGADELVVLTDNGYFSATDIAKCIAAGITPHVSTDDDKSFTMCIPAQEGESVGEPKNFDNKGKNVFVEERNIGLCPMGVILYPRSYRKAKGAGVYSNKKACKICPHTKDCKNYDKELLVLMRPSDFKNDYDTDGLRVKQITYKPDKKLLKKRKEIVEHPFGTIKRSMNSAYCLLKGIQKVRGEFSLTFLVYNMRRAINILGIDEILKAI